MSERWIDIEGISLHGWHWRVNTEVRSSTGQIVAVQDAYLSNRNHYLDPYMYHERLRRLQSKYWDKFELWKIGVDAFWSSGIRGFN